MIDKVASKDIIMDVFTKSLLRSKVQALLKVG